MSRPRRRLLWSVYLVAVAQLAVAGAAIFVVQRTLERAPWQYEPARHKSTVDGFGEFFDTPEALGRALSKLNDIDLTFYALDGKLVASTDPPLPALSPPDLLRLQNASIIFVAYHGPIPITAVPVVRSGAMVGYGLAHRRPPSSRISPPAGAPSRQHRPEPPLLPPPSKLPIVIAFALLGAAIISFLFARSLARPLARLAAAAEAFGAGDLSARARLQRDDELGAVARTFDEMADRVNGLLTASFSPTSRTSCARRWRGFAWRSTSPPRATWTRRASV
jgi:methyl-accepting chemotaxis protein